MNRRLRAVVTAVTTALALATFAPATPASAYQSPVKLQRSTGRFPGVIALPNGFQPEGIAIGSAPFAYLGSRATGQIYRANLVDGSGTEISPATGTPSLGMKLDTRGRLFVAGGSAGDGRVVDVETGEVLASYRFAVAPTFVNDVVLTKTAAYFTDSLRPVIYKVSLGHKGSLPPAAGFDTIPLTGDYTHQDGAFNANGIARTPDGKGLIIVQSSTGLLFRVNPVTGATTTVDAGAESFVNGDGLLLIGHTLYVVQNRLNAVAVVKLNNRGSTGEVTGRITEPNFDVPTTVAAFGNRLYLPNARFNTPPADTTPYAVVAVRRS
jgi:sugar lactone lactonase YvrE